MVAHTECEVGASAIVNAVIEVHFAHEGERFVGTVIKTGVHKNTFVIGVTIAGLITTVEVNVATLFALARKTGEDFPGVVGIGVADIDVAGRKNGV